MNKEILDKLVANYSITTVGNGYIDIIVAREKVLDFVNQLSKEGFVVKALSWWCFTKKGNNDGCPHGYGGPTYNGGYFSEMIDEFDELTLSGKTVEEVNQSFADVIKNKKTKNDQHGNSLTFSENKCLTPGIWIDVPDNWVTESLK